MALSGAGPEAGIHDLRAMIAALHAADVRYVIIGSVAAAAWMATLRPDREAKHRRRETILARARDHAASGGSPVGLAALSIVPPG